LQRGWKFGVKSRAHMTRGELLCLIGLKIGEFYFGERDKGRKSQRELYKPDWGGGVFFLMPESGKRRKGAGRFRPSVLIACVGFCSASCLFLMLSRTKGRATFGRGNCLDNQVGDNIYLPQCRTACLGFLTRGNRLRDAVKGGTEELAM